MTNTRISPARHRQLGDHTWQADAVCQSTEYNPVDPEIFFPEPDETDKIATAKSLCGQCPVRRACLDAALEGGTTDGIRGGLTEEERGPLHEKIAQRLDYSRVNDTIDGRDIHLTKAERRAVVHAAYRHGMSEQRLAWLLKITEEHAQKLYRELRRALRNRDLNQPTTATSPPRPAASAWAVTTSGRRHDHHKPGEAGAHIRLGPRDRHRPGRRGMRAVVRRPPADGHCHPRPRLPHLPLPLVIDGFIAYGIRALLVLRDAPLRARLYVWALFGMATAASIWANALHAVRLNEDAVAGPGLRLGDTVVAVLSTIAPLALAGAVHLYILIARRPVKVSDRENPGQAGHPGQTDRGDATEVTRIDRAGQQRPHGRSG